MKELLSESSDGAAFGDHDQPDESPIEEAKLPDLDDLPDDFDDSDGEIEDDFEPFDGFDDFENEADDLERHFESTQKDSFHEPSLPTRSRSAGRAKRKLFLTALVSVVLVSMAGGAYLVLRDYFRGVLVEFHETEFTRDIELFDARTTKISKLESDWRTAGTGGVVEEVTVAEGDRIRPGQILVRLKAPAKLGGKLEKSRTAAVKIQAKLQEWELKSSEATELLEDSERRLEDIGSDLKDAESKAEKKSLKAEQRKETKKRKRLIRDLKSVSRKLKSFRKKALQSQKKLDKIEASLQAYQVTSLASGTVMQLNATVGKKVKKGQKLVLIEDGGSLQIDFMMKSTDANKVPELPLIQVGQAVTEGYRSALKSRGKRAKVSVVVAVGSSASSIPPESCALVRSLGPTRVELTENVLLIEEGNDSWLWGMRDDSLVRMGIDSVEDEGDRSYGILEPGIKVGTVNVIKTIDGIEPELFDEGTEHREARAGELSESASEPDDSENGSGVDDGTEADAQDEVESAE